MIPVEGKSLFFMAIADMYNMMMAQFYYFQALFDVNL
jgi:hypothetical protein